MACQHAKTIAIATGRWRQKNIEEKPLPVSVDPYPGFNRHRQPKHNVLPIQTFGAHTIVTINPQRSSILPGRRLGNPHNERHLNITVFKCFA